MSARRVLLLLVVLAVALLALSIFQRDRALEQGYKDAQHRAEIYAGTVIRSGLTSRDTSSPLDGPTRTALLAEIQGFVLTDPAVARVRLWAPDGTLLFSTDPADEAGTAVRDTSIERASDGQVVSRLAAERLSPPATEEGEPRVTPLFQTFAPLRATGTSEVSGATEVEQFPATIEEAADDPWWVVQVATSGIAVMLALLAFVSVVRDMRRRRSAAGGSEWSDDRPGRPSRRGADRDDTDTAELRERLDRATTRAGEAEKAAKSFASRLREVSARLESVERQSADERVAELQEALRRSEAERAMLRSGRPETQLEAEIRRLRGQLREARSLATAAEAVVAGGGDLAPVKEQLVTAARQVDQAVERAKIAEGRADAAEDRARAAGDMATAAEQRIDVLEAKLRDIAGARAPVAGAPDVNDLRAQLEDAGRRVQQAEARASDLEARLAEAGSLDGRGEELLAALEARLVAAEARATESEARMRSFEGASAEEGGTSLRHRLGTAVGRKLAAPEPRLDDVSEEEVDLRASIARGLRGPLTRASGLTLTLQGSIETGEGRAALRQLSSSLRRLDQLAADLHDVQRIVDGTLPLQRKRTDLAALVATTVDESVHLEDRIVRFDADTVHARVDPARVRQIVDGMLEAARERTRAGAAIIVRVRDTDAGARVTVEDDNRIPATIGPELSLAVRLAELHRTELTVEGSSFRVTFQKDEP
ncbi:MAG TPA: hypothetical protein VFZ75_00085 [Actinomycetota bacterium]|nr:hypothetical protein [Actinomycetota bacterium]